MSYLFIESQLWHGFVANLLAVLLEQKEACNKGLWTIRHQILTWLTQYIPSRCLKILSKVTSPVFSRYFWVTLLTLEWVGEKLFRENTLISIPGVCVTLGLGEWSSCSLWLQEYICSSPSPWDSWHQPAQLPGLPLLLDFQCKRLPKVSFFKVPKS